MIRVLVAIVVVALSLFLSRCGYPFGVGEPKSVYYGPPVEEDDNDNGNKGYPNDVEEPNDVYYGPQADEDEEE